MPISIKVPDPQRFSGAVLPFVPSMEDLVNAIPNLVGAFDARDLTQGAQVSSWAARYGSGTLSQATASRRPTAGMDGSIPVVRNGALSRNLILDQALTSGAAITVGVRFKVEDTAQDFQSVFGTVAASWRLLYRTSAMFQFDAATDVFASGVGVAGWHTVVVMQSATRTRMTVNGTLYEVANTAPALTQLIIGASANTATANGFLGATYKVIVSQSDLYGTSHQASASLFLNS